MSGRCIGDPAGTVDIEQAMATAVREAVPVAFSHPSFDLWLLLHFTQLSGRQRGSSEVVHGKLRSHDGLHRRVAATGRA